MSGLSAASAPASLTSATTQTGPTSIFITALAGRAVSTGSAFPFAAPSRPALQEDAAIISTELDQPAPHSWRSFFLRDKTRFQRGMREPIVGCPANGSSRAA